jgi:hypothetical protein
MNIQIQNYLLDVMNRMTRIGIDKPPKSHLEPTLDRVESITYLTWR